MLTPYYSHNNQHFYAGHVCAVWPALAAQGVRVQTICTSIPYYSLRSYSTEPQVWGGDPACAHDWQERRRPLTDSGSNGATGSTLEGSKAHQVIQRGDVTEATCTRCTAWRGELGQEPTPDLFVAHIVAVFRAVRQVLRPDGTLWLNVGDSYSGNRGNTEARPGVDNKAARGMRQVLHKKQTDVGEKQLLLMPARVALALQTDGWVLRNELIWAKTAPMPESVQDRFTRAHEQIFVFAQQPRYFMDMAAIAEPISASTVERWGTVQPERKKQAREGLSASAQSIKGENFLGTSADGTRNPRDVWTLGPESTDLPHYAAYPTAIPRRAILAGTSAAGCCPACGAPYRRVVERTAMQIRRSEWGTQAGNRTASSGTMIAPPTAVTVGWQPGCRCNAGAPQPCLVADPFLGSGTTAAVAYELGRGCYGGDLNPQYLDLAVQRVASVTPWYARPDAPAREADYGPLFAGVA